MGQSTLDRWLALRRRERLAAAALAAALLVTSAVSFGLRWRQRLIDDARPQGMVVGVAGPDRLRVDLDGEVITAPLAGLAVPDAWAAQAERWLADQCLGRAVMLVRPRNGTRILTNAGWLVYTNGGLFVNEAALDQGLARPAGLTHDLSDWFERVAGWAEKKRRGGWADNPAE